MNNDPIKHALGFFGSAISAAVGTAWTLQRVNEWGQLVAWVSAFVCMVVTVNSWWRKRKRAEQKDFEEQAIKARHLHRLKKLHKEETTS